MLFNTCHIITRGKALYPGALNSNVGWSRWPIDWRCCPPRIAASLGAASNEVPTTCAAKETAFANIFATAGAVAQLAGVACGYLTDKMDPRATITMGGVLASGSLYVMGHVNPTPGQLYLLPAAYGILTLGGMVLLFSSFQGSFLWSRRQSIILTAANTFFDASAAAPLLLLQLYDAGLSRGTVLTAWAVLLAVACALQVVLWYGRASALKAAKNPKDAAPGYSPDGEPAAEEGGEPLLAEQISENGNEGDTAVGQAGGSMTSMPDAVRSKEFVFMCLCMAVNVFRSCIYLGTNGTLLAGLGDREHNYLYTRIFSLTLPAGVMCIPLISWTISLLSWRNVFHAINAIGLGWNLLALVPLLPLQALTGMIYTVFRAYLFSSIVGYCTSTFGASVSGRVYGLTTLMAGIFSTLQYPAMNLTFNSLGGDLRYLYGAMAVAVLPVVLLGHLWIKT